MSFGSCLWSPHSASFFSKAKSLNAENKTRLTSRFKASADVPDFLSANWYASDVPLQLQIFAIYRNLIALSSSFFI